MCDRAHRWPSDRWAATATTAGAQRPRNGSAGAGADSSKMAATTPAPTRSRWVRRAHEDELAVDDAAAETDVADKGAAEGSREDADAEEKGAAKGSREDARGKGHRGGERMRTMRETRRERRRRLAAMANARDARRRLWTHAAAQDVSWNDAKHLGQTACFRPAMLFGTGAGVAVGVTSFVLRRTSAVTPWYARGVAQRRADAAAPRRRGHRGGASAPSVRVGPAQLQLRRRRVHGCVGARLGKMPLGRPGRAGQGHSGRGAHQGAPPKAPAAPRAARAHTACACRAGPSGARSPPPTSWRRASVPPF